MERDGKAWNVSEGPEGCRNDVGVSEMDLAKFYVTSNGFGLAQSSQKPKAAGPGRSFVVVLQCVLLIKKKIFT